MKKSTPFFTLPNPQGFFSNCTTFEGPDGRLYIARFEKYTPEIALKILEEQNNKNRKKDKRHIACIHRDLTNQGWVMNGDSIKFSDTGRLLDGQHRLEGISKSGETVTILTVYGMAEEAFTMIDNNKRLRGLTDFASAEGFAMASYKSSIARRALLFERNYYGSLKGGGDKISRPTDTEGLNLIRQDDAKMNEAIELAAELKKKDVLMHFSVSSLAAYLFRKKTGLPTVQEFFDEFAKGTYKKGSPLLALNKTLASNLRKDPKKSRTFSAEQLALVIKAWNSYRKGERVEKLAYDSTKEKFPVPVR